jgi:adenine-specific DNA-methyltransferase
MIELVWAGKYKDGKKVAPVRLALPFQTIETVNESVQERQMMLDFFSAGRDSDWRNRLIWGDKKYVLPSLLQEFAGKVDLIYIDPPFATGADFSFTASVPDDPNEDGENGATFVKQPSILEQKAYRDTWGRGLDSFMQWFYETALILRELLSENGSIYVHLDTNTSHFAKAVLDEVFGQENYKNEISWKRTSAHANVSQRYGMIHDVIFYYTKSDKFTWNQQHTNYEEEYLKTFFDQTDEKGKRYARRDLTAGMDRASRGQIYSWRGITPPPTRCWAMTIDKMDELEAQGKIHWPKKTGGMPRLKLYPDDLPGIPLQDMWTDISPLHNLAQERVGYPTQKPESFLERFIQTSSNPGDLVLDCFCGSGTTAAVAEKLGRRWITCDLGRFAIHTARKRLLGITGVKPFVVQNLGKYERQAWQAAEFENVQDAAAREARYRAFILELYRAQPSSGAWLHGIKGGRMVHVGPVDAPITLSDVKAVARETLKLVGTGEGAPETAGADILGWDFAFELNEMGLQIAADAGVNVKFKKIPREVLEKKAVDQGDIKFFELAALTLASSVKGRTANLELRDFIISPDDVPADVMQKITHWSQWVDYWAVDWNYREDTFHNEWQAYRTRKQPKLEVKAAHVYETPGVYTVLVKVIDLLGNDTTKAVRLEVK